MKTRIIFAALLFSTFSVFAQTNDYKTSEIGIQREGLFFGDLGFTYRKQKSENKFRNLEIVTGGGIFNGNILNLNRGLTVKTGIEKRRTLGNPNISYVHGWMYGLGLKVQNGIGENSVVNLSPQIGYNFGWQYKINDNFNLRAEITPTLEVISTVSKYSGNNINFNTKTPISVGVSYRINK